MFSPSSSRISDEIAQELDEFLVACAEGFAAILERNGLPPLNVAMTVAISPASDEEGV